MSILLTDLLKEPGLCLRLKPADWNVLVPQGRATGLLGTLCALLEEHGLLKSVPGEVRRHLESVLCTHRKQRENLEYEVAWLRRALGDIGEKLVVLKGGAYILANLPAGSGRLISDIDLLVPERNLHRTEEILRDYGWESPIVDTYDDRYYRQWMHEIPPMAHVDRDSVLDVHHTILPPTADEKLEPGKLFEALWEIRPGLFVLSPLDMVLHSATHLFHEGEFGHGLRDLIDLDRLLRHFAALDAHFWERLVPRAREMGMQKSLSYALRYCRKYFATPVPEEFIAALGAQHYSPGVRGMMDWLFERGFSPDHSSCRLSFTPLARFCLYVRSHYLRMPLYLLVPHLVRKAWMGRFGGPVLDDVAEAEAERA